MIDGPALILLTSTFPWGNKAETFLEAEVPFLARRFPRVLVLPSHREGGRRPLPENVEVVEMPWLDGYPAGARRRALLDPTALEIGLRTLREPGNVGPYLRDRRLYADLLARNVLKARDLRRFLRRRGLTDALGYDYWFENSTLALGLVRASGHLRTAVARGHGFDVYDERWAQRRAPFRREKARRLDRIFVVSRFGTRYLRERLPGLEDRVGTAYLGVGPGGTVPAARARPTVLTCSSLVEGKRVHLVPRVLATLDRPLRWVHLGDGPERSRVETAAREELGDPVSWTLRGHVDNAEVLRFYREEGADVLLSLSASEGLPVSMMEALSFGVPVVATGVGGVPELVEETTGVLLPPGAGPDEAAAGLTRALDPGRFDRDLIRAFFLERFEAGANYNAFADALLALWQDQAAAG